MNVRRRNPAADIIRVLGFFFVVSVHFFSKNGYYSFPVSGGRMYVMTLMRSFFIICVPLFIMLSGCLLRKKRLEKSYYKRISKIIITYVLASLLCVGYSIVHLKQVFTVKQIILNILNFTAAPYAWYIEMYIGLFLLIPFLNILYNGLPSQKSKIWLIVTFAILSSLPSVLNVYNYDSLAWWRSPSSSSTLSKLVPAWWETLYPITYYFIGCYLSEYGLKIKKAVNALLIIVWTIISGTYCYWRSYKVVFVWNLWCGYQSLFNVVLATLVFAFLVNINYDKLPNWLVWILQKISGLCLGGYLVSWVFDDKFYPELARKVLTVPQRLEYYVIMVPVIFVLSLAASYVLSLIQLVIEKFFGFIAKLFKKEEETIPAP